MSDHDAHEPEFVVDVRTGRGFVTVTCRRCAISVSLPLTETGELPRSAGEFAEVHSREGHERPHPHDVR